MAKILIVDDEETIRKLLVSSVQRHNHEALAVEDGYRACDVYENFAPDVIVSDIKMPKMNGFQMFDQLKEKHGEICPVIFITGHGEKSAAIESLRKGAFDYLEKPFDMDDFFHRLQAAVNKRGIELENKRLTSELGLANKKLEERLEARTELVRRIQHPEKISPTIDVLGTAAAIRPAKEAVNRLTQNELGAQMSVLITGPSGSGKEIVARLIHDLSPRANGPWVPVNCSALPENLIESELFGHEKGAFSGAGSRKLGMFELADGGTLFLDEIGELPQPMQAKLLRTLQEKKIRRLGGTQEISVAVRIIAATNRDLKKSIGEKTFREDLYFRLNNYHIPLPTLKERHEDIMPFAEQLLAQATRGARKPPNGFSAEAKMILLGYDWPGNIRELKSVVERAILLNSSPMISPDAIRAALGIQLPSQKLASSALSLVPSGRNGSKTATPPSPNIAGIPYHEWKKGFMQTMERDYLQQQLGHFQGNVSSMARTLKISRPNLCRLLRKHGIVAENFREFANDGSSETKAA